MAKVAIVGGGIAGLYCALKLSEQQHAVFVYESLDRWGGRIETADLGDFKAECGPMRFELKIEPLFSKLADELGVKFDHFTPPHSPSPEFPKHDLQPNELSAQHRKAVEKILGKGSHSETVSGIFSHHTSALDLLKFGIYRIFHRDPQDQARSLAEVLAGGKASKITAYSDSLSDTDYDLIRTTHRLDGVSLYMLGFWNALSRVLSPGAVAKIRDTGTFYHLLPENPSASEWAIFWLRLFRSDAQLWTIKSGVETIVHKLREKLKKQQTAHLLDQKTVEEVAPSNSGQVRVKIAGEPNFREDVDHVVFAIPAVPLLALAENFPRDILEYVKGVIPFPLLKTFAVVRDPWWDNLPEPQQGAHLVPTREIHYFAPEDGSTDRAMIMLYTDRPATAYWHPHVEKPHKRAQIDPHTPQLKHELARQLAQLLPRHDSDEEAHLRRVEQSITHFAVRDWSEPPFSAACHAWRPKFNVPQALASLKAFGLEGNEKVHNAHVCGEAYSDYQGFIEGALRSATNVLQTI
jgi:hypothetical protein